MVSGKISAGEAYVMVSCETEKLEQGLRDVHQKLERETEHIAATNRQLELEFKVDGGQDRRKVEPLTVTTKKDR